MVTARHCVSWEETGDVVEVNMVAVWLGSHAKQVRGKKLKPSCIKGQSRWMDICLTDNSSELLSSSLVDLLQFLPPLDAEKNTTPLQMKGR